MELRVQFKGLREIERNMLELPKRVDRRLLEEGLGVAGRMVRDEARLLAPELAGDDPRWSKGALRRAIRSARIRPREYSAEVIVGVRSLSRKTRASFKQKQAARRRAGKRSRRIDPRDAYYWHWVEFGRAGMPARPFLRPAFEAKKEAAVAAAIEVFRKRVQLEIEKLGRTIH